MAKKPITSKTKNIKQQIQIADKNEKLLQQQINYSKEYSNEKKKVLW